MNHCAVLSWILVCQLGFLVRQGRYSLAFTTKQADLCALKNPEKIVRAKLLQLCLTLWDPMDHSPPGSSVHGILQSRILEWVAISSSKGISWPRDWALFSFVSCIGRWVLYHQCHLGSPRENRILIKSFNKRSIINDLKIQIPALHCILILRSSCSNLGKVTEQKSNECG